MLFRRRTPANRRKYQRVTIEATLATLFCLTDQHVAADELPPMVSEDISPDGLFLRTTKTYVEGTQVALKLHLPTMTQPFACQARVARVERRPNGEVRGVGLQFVGLSDVQRQQLVEHLYRSYQVQHASE